jgi:PAS domain S-box-containing protein
MDAPRKLVENDLLNLIVGGLLIALSTSVLIGWYIHSTRLVQVSPEFAPMQFNTAFCFLLSGIALCLRGSHPRISGLLGALTLLFSSLILFQYVFQINLGIDTLFINPYINTRTFYPGRMAPNTAISFVLIGLMFIFNAFLRDKKIFAEAALILPMMIFILAFVALLGYIINISSAYTWGPFAGMAVHATIGFILMTIPSIPSTYQKLKTSLKTNNYFLGAVIFFSMLTLFLLLTQIIMSKAGVNFQERIKKDSEFLSEKMLVLMQQDIEALNRLFFRINNNAYRTPEALHQDAALYLQNIPWIEVIRINQQQKNSPPLTLTQIGINAETQQNLIHSCQENPIQNIHSSTQSNLAFSIVGTKICLEDKVTKSIVILNLASIMKSFLVDLFAEKYYVELSSDHTLIYKSQPYFDTTNPHFYFPISFYLHQIPLKLTLYRKNANYDDLYGWLIFPFFGFGLFLSALLAIVIHLLQGGRISAEKLKIALNEKHESEEILKHIIRSSPGAILIVKKNDTLAFFNDKALELWGYSKDQFKEQSIGNLMPERFRKSHYEFRQKYYKNPKLIPLGSRSDLCILTQSGKEVPVELELNPMAIKGETQILCTFMNIAQRKKNEAQLEKYMVELTRSNEALHDFAYIASHDLKEPLRGISNFSEFLLEDYSDKLDESGKEKLETLLKLSKRMASLIDTLLVYSRIGSLDLQLKSLAIQPIINEKMELLSPLLKEKNVDITLSDNLPTLIVDGARIGEVFQNLITNAIKYNDNDIKKIHISVSEDKDNYIFSIQDNGIGIAEENFEKIFKIFKRLHGRNEYGGGTGAGMTIIKKIIERHEGEIWLESKIGSGTTFYFTISKKLKPHQDELEGEE